jgi:hypothetical protein
MKNIAMIFFALMLCLSCARNKEEESRTYYRKMVKQRMESIMTDSTYRELPAIHEEIEKIILVSKDSENPAAAFDMAHTLFNSLSQTYEIDRNDFPDIDPNMSTPEIELRIRENELAFFDRLAMKVKPGSSQLFTAH